MFGLGSWNTWDRIPPENVAQILRAAIDAGVSLFDVAHYDFGPHAEQGRTDLIFGEAIRQAGIAREQYQLCGKLWLWEYPRIGFDTQLSTAFDRVGIQRADAVVVGDYLDSPDIARIVTEVNEQVRAGRFSSWGVNNWLESDLRRAFEFADREGLLAPSFAQLKYSIVRRSMAEGPFYHGLFASGRLALQASDIFEGGILAGHKYPDRKIGADPGNIRDAIRAGAELVATVAARYEATPAQVAVAFCLTNPDVRNVLFGVSTLAQLADNLAGLALSQQHGPALRAALAELWLDRDEGSGPA
ncbi:MAG: aldo/keto reductase [Actinomycetota bacterium]|nr:aldo/keto reductase [Actinomycetota bacterium]MDQ2955763.1 aldo/keto reductase [Actinomycetota bacterium]